MKSFLLAVLFSSFLLFVNAQFTAGNLTVLQVDASASNTTGSIIEINPTTAGQAAISTIAINGTAGTSALRFSGSATSTGYLANSNDGTLVCFTGANTTTSGSTNINTILPRGVGTLNNAQTFNLATTYTGGSGNQTRSATTLDNSIWYIGDQGGLYTNGSTSASPSSVNLRGVKSFGGTVYAMQASSTASVLAVGILSAPSSATYTGLPGFTNNANAQDFYLISSGSNGAAFDVLYVVSATANTAGAITKYSLVSGTWVSNGSYTTTFGGFGMAAKANGTGAFLYVSTGQGAMINNSVLRLTDAAGYNAAINITATINLYTATNSKIIKGVAFSPIAAPSVIANPNTYAFGNVLVGAASAGQTISLTASNLNAATGSMTVTAPSTNFQVSNDGTTWASTTTVAYSGSGSTIANFYIRFTPQTSGAKTGNVAITGGGLANAVNVAVTGTGDNALSFTNSTNTTTALNPPYISGTINDPNDPALVSGIVLDVKESGVAIASANYSVSVSSSNTTVVPNANVAITKADGLATIKINPAAVGYATITVTLTKGTDTKDYVINYAASQSPTSTTNWLTGISNASTAIALDDDYMVIGDDETNVLYVYNRKQPGLPVKTYDFNQGNILNLTDGAPAYKEVDVEASTRGVANPTRMYWLGSMSNSSSFNDKPNRNRLFAVNASGTGAATSFTNAGYYAGLRQQLITWGDGYGYNFTASAAEGVDPKTINGFNVEGMAFGPDNTTLYIGFRAPLIPMTSRTKAVIAPIVNFEVWFNNGSPVGNPTIGAPIELNLGGRGIRELYRLSNGVIVIVAGSYDGTSNPAIYTWSGVAADAPVLQPSFNVTGLNAEAVLGVNEGGQLATNKLQVICDDGSTVFYGDGVEAKDLPQANYNKFSSDIVVSPYTILPIPLNYFTATKSGADVMLNWQTANGDDGVVFDILRSTNGQDFTTIQTVSAIANKNTYSYNDVNVPGTKLYYRIATKSADGQKLFSAIRVVDITGAAPIVKIYPNPVVNNIFSVETNNIGNKKLGVYNSEGVLYKYYEYTGTIKNIYTNGWPRGTYLLRIMGADGIMLPVQKIVVL